MARSSSGRALARLIIALAYVIVRLLQLATTLVGALVGAGSSGAYEGGSHRRR